MVLIALGGRRRSKPIKNDQKVISPARAAITSHHQVTNYSLTRASMPPSRVHQVARRTVAPKALWLGCPPRTPMCHIRARCSVGQAADIPSPYLQRVLQTPSISKSCFALAAESLHMFQRTHIAHRACLFCMHRGALESFRLGFVNHAF